MKKRSIFLWQSVAAVIPILAVAAVLTGCATPRGEWIIQNPYAGVDWARYQQHKANFHTHTTMSDGSGTPQAVIDRYHALGYTILTLTDHDTMGTECTTWPWQVFDRDPETLAMMAIEGNEISRVHHIGSYFNGYGNADVDSEDTVIKEIGRRSGLAVLFHPGRYTKPVEWYVEMYRAYPHLVGLEIYNQGDKYPYDRKTWDAILTDIATDRPVWGFSNDDMHNPETQLGRNWNVILLPELSAEWVRRSIENGAFLFVHASDDHDGSPPPTIKSIAVDIQRGIIRIDAIGHEKIEWISRGIIVHRGHHVNLSELSTLSGYIRAEIRSAKGGSIVGTQPFRIQPLPVLNEGVVQHTETDKMVPDNSK